MKKIIVGIALIVAFLVIYILTPTKSDVPFQWAIELFQKDVKQRGCINTTHPALDTMSNYKYILYVPAENYNIQLPDSIEKATIVILPTTSSSRERRTNDNTLFLPLSYINVVTKEDAILFSIESTEKDDNQRIKYQLRKNRNVPLEQTLN
ncbi:MAG: hypothetical protein R3Y68_08970 [Rikenellaceae bacterium]